MKPFIEIQIYLESHLKGKKDRVAYVRKHNALKNIVNATAQDYPVVHNVNV